MKYTLRQPISSDRLLDREGLVLSRHRTIEGAMRALEKRERELMRANPRALPQYYILDETSLDRVQGGYEFVFDRSMIDRALEQHFGGM